ncbi:MAG: HD domain-containing protein [Deltaproteobacteria bacterium]|jgi:3'-5' exoribonuclease|nr:HD domain-containing protein [Deltaproteobacteria bacterium]
MDKKQFVAELAPGEMAEGLFLVAAAQQNQARNGPYWRVEFRDATGKIEGKIWSPLSQQFSELKPGCLAELQGRVVVYRERNEIVVDQMRLLDEEEQSRVNLADFMAASRQDADSMLAELEEICRATFSHKPWIKFYKALLRDEEVAQKLRLAPAAKAMHHAYSGGLLEHTLGVCRLCLSLADLYPDLDRQTLLAGALCHDLGKIWELSSGLVIDYTGPGRLIGHISLGVEKLEPFLRKSGLEDELAEHLKHLVLSHHGSREFGSPCLPATAEALALHYADNLDAKLNQARTALQGLAAGESGWSAYVSGLERALFKAPCSTAGPTASSGLDGRKAAKAKSVEPSSGQGRLLESQCSLLSKG